MSHEPDTVQTDTLVLYHTENGEKYHRNAACATQGFDSPYIDGGEDLFSRLEMTRYGDIEPDNGDLCKNCANPLVKDIDL